jgi:hypothetical protein
VPEYTGVVQEGGKQPAAAPCSGAGFSTFGQRLIPELMSDTEPDYLTISYRPDLEVLVGRWMRQVSFTEMCEGYHRLLEAAVAHQCRQWLIDVRRRFNTDREGAHWMVTEFLPTLQPNLGGRTHLAYLLAPLIMRDPAGDSAFPSAETMADKPFLGERFIDEAAAIVWLQKMRQQPVL